jgi:hypothetical protein
MDFTLIRTDIFKDLGPSPWFKTADHQSMFDPETGGISLFTEDTYFVNRAIKAGKKVAVHSGCRIGHMNVKSGEVY